MIQCQNGETILLTHDTHLPRPYSIGFRVQGTEGIWMDVAQGIHIEGKSKPHAWDPAKEWVDKYDHPIWKNMKHLQQVLVTVVWIGLYSILSYKRLSKVNKLHLTSMTLSL